jgi:hypothetical protein
MKHSQLKKSRDPTPYAAHWFTDHMRDLLQRILDDRRNGSDVSVKNDIKTISSSHLLIFDLSS